MSKQMRYVMLVLAGVLLAASGFERGSLVRGHGWMVKGSFARVLRDYNELVRASNNVRFR